MCRLHEVVAVAVSVVAWCVVDMGEGKVVPGTSVIFGVDVE